MRYLFSLALFLLPLPAIAQVFTGAVRVVDGDTLDMTGQRVRLYGIDAPESAQACQRSGQAWSCGVEARRALEQWTAGQSVSCTQKDRDTYGRIVAQCHVGRMDLSEELARTGLAVSLPNITDAYLEAEHFAQGRKHGMWAGEFQRPADFRHANPVKEAVPATLARPASSRATPRAAMPVRQGVYFRNCQEAWSAGYAPMHRGQPGYRPELDGDHDGIACEPIPTYRRYRNR